MGEGIAKTLSGMASKNRLEVQGNSKSFLGFARITSTETPDSLNGEMVGGTLEGSNPDEIIKILCSLIQREYKFEQGKYVIY